MPGTITLYAHLLLLFLDAEITFILQMFFNVSFVASMMNKLLNSPYGFTMSTPDW